MQYLTSLGPLADEGLVNGSEDGRVVIDVEQADVDGGQAALMGVICRRNTGEKPSHLLGSSLLLLFRTGD